MEDRRLGRRRSEAVPVRVKELRRACLEALADPATTPAEAGRLRCDLDDLFVVVQLFSYPGDYVKECPTVERVAETLMKFEQDVFAITDMIRPRGPRRAIVRLGTPIDVADSLKSAAKPRHAIAALTTELERRMQEGLDALLVTNFKNVTYLTGFTGDDSYLLVLPRGEVLISDQRYTTQLEEECPALELAIRGPGTKMLGETTAHDANIVKMEIQRKREVAETGDGDEPEPEVKP